MYRTAIYVSLVTAFVLALPVQAAKKKKEQGEVQKALTQKYPDAKTEITGTSEVNGVKVYDVKVTTKQGESTAQVTDYGDFLMHGVPHEYGAVRNAIEQDISGLFAAKPEDVQMFRETTYFVDFKGPKGKNYTATFDAVGRLKDIRNSSEIERESTQAVRGEKVSDDAAIKKATGFVKRELPSAEVEAVYQGQEGQDFWNVQTKGGGEVVVNQQGQVLSLREPITKEEFPEPVAASIKQVFTAPIDKLWRGETEYYQFNQQAQRGQPLVVKMRPNGDIIEVQNVQAIQDEQATQAKSKQKG